LKEKEEQKSLKESQRQEQAAPAAGARESELWVDKFSPKHFMELLSDEVRM